MVGVRFRATVVTAEEAPRPVPMPAMVTFDSNDDGRRDDFREDCTATFDNDTLTAVCPPRESP